MLGRVATPLIVIAGLLLGCSTGGDVTAIHYTVHAGDDLAVELETVWVRVLDPDHGTVIEPAEDTSTRLDLADTPLPRTGLVYPGREYREAVLLEALGLRDEQVIARIQVRAEFRSGRITETELVLAAAEVESEGDAEVAREAADDGPEPDAELDSEPDAEPPVEADEVAPEPEPEREDPEPEPERPAEPECSPCAPEAVLAFQSPAVGEVPIRIDGRASSDRDGHIVSYRFGFGDGQPDQEGPAAEASHLYFCAGEYTVRLTVTDNDGLTGTIERSLEIVPMLSNVDGDGLTDCDEENDDWGWTDRNIYNGMELLVFAHDGRDECFWLTDLTRMWSEHVAGKSPLAQVRVTEGWLHVPDTGDPLVVGVPGLTDSGLDAGLVENVILVYRGTLKVPPGADAVTIDPRSPDDNLAVRLDGDWFLADDSGIINCTWTENGGTYEIAPSSEHLVEIMMVNFGGPYGWDLKFQFNDGQDLTQRLLRAE